MDSFCQVYETQGYYRCADGLFEPGFKKVAMFGKQNLDGRIIPTHAALQLSDGRWTSKLGPAEDIEHDIVDAVACPTYGTAMIYLKQQV